MVCISLISDVQYLFICLYVFFAGEKNVYSSPFSIIKMGLFFFCFWVMWVYMYISDINPFLEIHSANIFPYSIGCCFIVWWFSLLCSSFLVWWSPSCYFYFCLPLLLVPNLKYHHQERPMSRSLPPICLLGILYIVSGLMFKCLINFKLIFVYGVK